MLHCIVGVVLAACNPASSMTIPGKLAYAPDSHSQPAWNYAATYQVPALNPQPFTVVTIRRV